MIWNDSLRMKAIHARLKALGIDPGEPGKGRNVWFCIGYLLGQADSAVMALHDCDIVTYKAEMLTRLVYPLGPSLVPVSAGQGVLPAGG